MLDLTLISKAQTSPPHLLPMGPNPSANHLSEGDIQVWGEASPAGPCHETCTPGPPAGERACPPAPGSSCSNLAGGTWPAGKEALCPQSPQSAARDADRPLSLFVAEVSQLLCSSEPLSSCGVVSGCILDFCSELCPSDRRTCCHQWLSSGYLQVPCAWRCEDCTKLWSSRGLCLECL